MPATAQAPRHSGDGPAALTRAVAERTVTDKRVTDHHPFHCWKFLITRFTVGCSCSQPPVIPHGGEAPLRRVLPVVHPIVAESADQRGDSSAQFGKKG